MHKTTINTKFYCIFKCCIGSWHGRNSKMTIFQNINTWKPCFMIYHYHYSCPTKRSLYWRKQAQIFFGWGCGVKLHFKCLWSSGRSILVHQWPPCKYNLFHDKCIQITDGLKSNFDTKCIIYTYFYMHIYFLQKFWTSFLPKQSGWCCIQRLWGYIVLKRHLSGTHIVIWKQKLKGTTYWV